MAILWRRTDGQSWYAAELYADARLDRDSIEPLEAGVGFVRSHRHARPLLHRHDSKGAAAPTWLVLAPPGAGVHVNAEPLATGIRALADRDAIRLPDSSTLYFSTERLARIEAFAGAQAVFCPRCKLEIAAGDPAVCCPACGVWHHEHAAEGRTCWSYTETCALCDQPTEIDSARYRWTPETL